MDEAADEPPRAKFLCSFGGSIIPRPLDARLRYVGGETRIVSLPRDVTYDDLLARMRDLFDGVSIIKYQQPDEDLDALVSVVNDDDVVNMMEEYDKLLLTSANGDGGGCSRIRIFLFSHHNTDPDAAAAAQFDVDERENERRYVDALNNLEISTNLENSDQFLGLHQLNIPHPHARLGEESPWSPAYFSPQFPNSPSAAPPPPFDQQSPTLVENLMWGLPGVGIVQEKGGFPGNIGHAHNMFEGSNVVCEHCRMGLQRDPRYVDLRWNQSGCGNEYMGHFVGSCSDCYRAREMPRFYNEAHGHDRGWIPHMHQGGHDPRMHRIGDHYVVDGNVLNAPFGQVNYYDGHDDDRYPRATGNEFGNEVFHGQHTGGQGNHPAQYGLENAYTRATGNEFGNEVFHGQHTGGQGNHPAQYGLENPYPRATGNEFGNEVFHGQHAGGEGNHPAQYGLESPYQVPPNLPPIQNLRGRAQVPARSGMPYDSSRLMAPNGFVRSTQDLSLPVPHIVVDDQFQSPWSGQNGGLSQKNYGIDDHGSRFNPNFVNLDERILVAPVINLGVKVDVAIEENVGMKGVKPTEVVNVGDSNANVGHEGQRTTYLPELTAFVHKVALESPQEVKALAEENPENKKEPCSHELETGNVQHDLEPEADAACDQTENSRIEPTTAEAEALAQGLQTIKYDDLEEVRELGSGTYGSVYHGKWKGSDVAIKKIKASCFNGKPSERERLIADFWKEALMLSSLHHPNVVSFYGVARDGPDGSLATVTEFMVNGSLKQFLKKKDRTIDRRKRLIIAMDAAFGMEYVHGKNIVHFDLKCENLLVNMRDPQRPICKIGDLGLSKVKQRTLVSGGVRGTLPWMAPELLSGKKNMVTEKVDVYSFGIVMWELLTGDDPYGDMHFGSILGGIMENSLRPQIPTWCEPEWKSLMESCWSSVPAERPSFTEISQRLRKMAAAINLK